MVPTWIPNTNTTIPLFTQNIAREPRVQIALVDRKKIWYEFNVRKSVRFYIVYSIKDQHHQHDIRPSIYSMDAKLSNDVSHQASTTQVIKNPNTDMVRMYNIKID